MAWLTSNPTAFATFGVCFIVEDRNRKGKPYPPSSLQSMSLHFCVTHSRLRSRYSIWGPSKTALNQVTCAMMLWLLERKSCKQWFVIRVQMLGLLKRRQITP